MPAARRSQRYIQLRKKALEWREEHFRPVLCDWEVPLSVAAQPARKNGAGARLGLSRSCGAEHRRTAESLDLRGIAVGRGLLAWRGVGALATLSLSPLPHECTLAPPLLFGAVDIAGEARRS